MLTTTTTDGQTDCFTPCACVRGNKGKAMALNMSMRVWLERRDIGYKENVVATYRLEMIDS